MEHLRKNAHLHEQQRQRDARHDAELGDGDAAVVREARRGGVSDKASEQPACVEDQLECDSQPAWHIAVGRRVP